MKPRVCVLLSSYNGAPYLREQVESVMAQQGDFDLILHIRDDGSTDDSPRLLEKLRKEYPGRLFYEKGENMGLNASFFRLLDQAPESDYYALCDHDDKWLPGKIQAAVEALSGQKEPALYACTSRVTDRNLNPVGQTRPRKRPLVPANTLIQNICPGHNQVMNQALRELVRRPRQVDRIYVYDLWIANTAALYGKIIFDNTPRTLYRQHTGNELGYGRGGLGRLIKAGRRAMAGEGGKNKKQMAFFLEENRNALERLGLAKPMEALLSADSFGKRLRFALHCPFYRQSRWETLAFKLAVIFGRY